jgi:hypothetical protein
MNPGEPLISVFVPMNRVNWRGRMAGIASKAAKAELKQQSRFRMLFAHDAANAA